MPVPSWIVVYFGVLIGVLARAFMPYLRKSIRENLPITWEARYTALLIVGIISSMLIYPLFQVPPNGPEVLFFAAFIFGFGVDALLIEIWAWVAPIGDGERPV